MSQKVIVSQKDDNDNLIQISLHRMFINWQPYDIFSKVPASKLLKSRLLLKKFQIRLLEIAQTIDLSAYKMS